MDEKWEVAPRSDLDQLVDKVSHGATVELTRDGKTVARVVPAAPASDGPPSWEELTRLRQGVRLPAGVSIDDLISDGRKR